jgi:hypothetical protein
MNKVMLVCGLLVAVAAVNAFGVALPGTPTAELKKGQWNVGYGYTYSDIDLDQTKVKYVELEEVGEGEYALAPGQSKLDFDDVKTHFHYLTIGYGIDDWWEVYAQLGIADVKYRTIEPDNPDDEWSGRNLDNDFAWGIGTKVTFYKQDNVEWGVVAQMNWIDTGLEEKYTEEDVTYKDELTWKTRELLIAVGPTVDMGGWWLYGGPFYYDLSGDSKFKEKVDGIGTVYKDSLDLNEDSNFGGYVGAKFIIAENTSLNFDVAAVSGGWAAGTGLVYRF